MITEPSNETPAKRPFVELEVTSQSTGFPAHKLDTNLYEKIPATDLKLAAPLASAFFPIGPAATDTFPPSVTLPASENVLTALWSFKIMTKSVNSAPICPPNPTLKNH
jgi:hypothetical protein